MSARIVAQAKHVRQAVAQFALEYPGHAKEYAAAVENATAIVKRRGVARDSDGLGFRVSETFADGKTAAFNVANRVCTCGAKVCRHRIAVCLAVMAEHWAEVAEHVEKTLAIAEAAEVHQELAEPNAAPGDYEVA